MLQSGVSTRSAWGAWLVVDSLSRSQVFGFGVILDRLKSPLGLGQDQVLREKLEYTHHSQWMHAVPYEENSDVLSIEELTEELVGHVNAVMREISFLRQSGLKSVPEIPEVPVDLMPNGWSDAVEWRVQRQHDLDIKLKALGVHFNRDRALPRGMTASSMIERDAQSQD